MSKNADSETLAEPGLSGPQSPDAMVGKTLKGLYRIDGPLGQGAMGVVYRGTQLSLGKTVAIKMIRADILVTKESHDRFVREAQVLSKLLHPGIAQVLDFGIEANTPFLVMEFVDGKELTEVTKLEGPMAPLRAITIIRQLSAALEEAHRNGVVHRDIKPHNIRLQRYSPSGPIYLKVLDFGIAKQLGDEVGTSLTATGAVIGTPAYMAPEQAGGSRIDAKADQYAVGIVLYELLTGTVPFTSDTVTGVLVSHLTKPPPPLPRQVPEPLQRIVMRLLEKEPGARYPDIASLERALADCEGYCRDARPLAKKVTHADQGDAGSPKSRRLGPVLGAVIAAAVVSGLVMGVVRFQKGSRTGTATPTPNPNPTDATGSAGLAAKPTGPSGTATAPAQTNPVEQNQAGPSAGPGSAQATATPKPTTEVATTGSTGQASDKNKTGSEPKTKPAATAAKRVSEKGAGQAETSEVKDKLDQAERYAKSGDYPRAIDLARRTIFTAPSARAYRLLTLSHCKMGNFVAKATFFQVAAGDRKNLIQVCRENGVTLP